jgi:hypothetical protein
LSLQEIHQVKGGENLHSCVFTGSDGVADHVFENVTEDTTDLFRNAAPNSLDAASTYQPSDGRFGNALNALRHDEGVAWQGLSGIECVAGLHRDLPLDFVGSKKVSPFEGYRRFSRFTPMIFEPDMGPLHIEIEQNYFPFTFLAPICPARKTREFSYQKVCQC